MLIPCRVMTRKERSLASWDMKASTPIFSSSFFGFAGAGLAGLARLYRKGRREEERGDRPQAVFLADLGVSRVVTW
jgi:hypothetical protein